MVSLSAIVITRNEEASIDRCLESLRWVDEIILVDSFSSDSTLEKARRYTDRILQHPYDGDIPQRERGFAAASGEWLLYIDADEVVSEELAQEIRRAIAQPGDTEGYSIPRIPHIFGAWIRHGGWPDETFRLFRKDRYVAERAEVHGGFTVRGSRGSLHAPLYHYPYASFEQYLSKMNDYTSLAVSARLDAPPVGLRKILLSPPAHFLRGFVTRRGYRDGLRGFFLAALGAFYTLALYTKVWEYRMRRAQGAAIRPPITNRDIQEIKRLEG